MAIKENFDGTVRTFDVHVSFRSQQKAGVRVQRRKEGVKNLREAQAIEKALIKEASLELSRLENQTLSWGELLDRYELSIGKPSMMVRRAQDHIVREMVAFSRQWTSDWYQMDARDVTPGCVRKVLRALEDQQYSSGRIRSMKTAINGVFRFGIEEGLLDGVHGSPAQLVQVQKYIEDKPPQILSAAEVNLLLSKAKAEAHPWYAIWFVALHTGMRSGELFALEWADIDWENKLVTVSKSWNGRMKAIKSTKAGYWRKVPMNAELEAMLKDLRMRTSHAESRVLPRATRWQNGEQAKYLQDYCRLIGIRPVNFHALRACFATHLLNAGVSSPRVKKICGWSDEKVMNRYIRLAGVDVSGATDVLGFTGGQSYESETELSLKAVRGLKLVTSDV